jgi:hypothetical protein
VKKSEELQPQSAHQILIEKAEGPTSDLTKDILVFYRLKKMD